MWINMHADIITMFSFLILNFASPILNDDHFR